MTDPSDLITREDFVELFGDEAPIEAFEIVWNAPPGLPVAEVRKRLRDFAAAWRAALPAPHVTKQEPSAGIDDAMAHACQLAGYSRGPLPGVDYAKIDARLSGRRAFRSRVRATIALLLTTGELSRLDLIQIGEISMKRATLDLAKIDELFPGVVYYDNRRKRFLCGPNADALRTQTGVVSAAISAASAENAADPRTKRYRIMLQDQIFSDGGRDRDRTCDPHDVNVSNNYKT